VNTMTSDRIEGISAQGAKRLPRPDALQLRPGIDAPERPAEKKHDPALPRPGEGTPGKPGPPQHPDQTAKAQPAANVHPGMMAEAAGAGIAVTTIIRELAWDVGPPLVAYFALRLVGVGGWLALLAATLVAVSRAIWLAMRIRTLNLYAMLMVEVFGLDLALSFLPGDARLPLVKGSIIAATLGITWLVMVALGHPPSLEAVKLWEPRRAAWRAEQFRTDPDIRHANLTISTVWGAAFLTQAIVLVPLIYLLPSPVMGVVSTAVGIAYMGALIGWVGWYQRHLVRCAQEQQPGSADADSERLGAAGRVEGVTAADPTRRLRTRVEQPVGTARAEPEKQGNRGGHGQAVQERQEDASSGLFSSGPLK